MSYRKWPYSPMILLVGVSLLSSCVKQDGTSGATPTPPGFSLALNTVSEEQPLMQLQYAAETTTHYLTDSDSELDKVHATPYVEKQEIVFTLYENGEAAWILENALPDNPIPFSHETLPDHMPRIAKTILKSGSATFYSAAGEQLYQSEAQIPLMTDLVQNIQEAKATYTAEAVNAAVSTLQMGTFTGAVNDFLTHAAAYNASVENLEDNLVSITVPNSAMSNPEVPATGETIILFDKTRNLLLGTTCYDAEGRILNSTYYRYAPEGSGYRIAAIRSRQATTMPSGASGVLETVSTLSNFHVTIH